MSKPRRPQSSAAAPAASLNDEWTPALDAVVGSAQAPVPTQAVVAEPSGAEDDELSAVERTGAQLPFDLEPDEHPGELQGDQRGIVIDADPEDEAAAGTPDLLSSAGGDRTAAYDPPADLFEQVPDPEAQPVAQPFHLQSTAFLPPVRPAAAAAVAPRPSIEVDEALIIRQDTEAAAAELNAARAAVEAKRRSAVAAKPQAQHAPVPELSPPRKDRRDARPHGPMHKRKAPTERVEPVRPVDPAENELTGVYEPPTALPELPRAKLLIVEGENQGKSYFLNRNHTSVGRGIDNDVVLMDLSVSRRHFRVDRHGEGFKLVDLGSGNGTQINGQRREEGELYDKDQVALGNTILEVSYVSLPRVRATNAQPTDPRHVLTPATAGARATTAPNSAPEEQRVPWRWIALWSVVTFCVVLLGMLAVRELRRGDTAPDEASLKARDQMALAESAIKVRAWGRAEEALTVARSLAPKLDLPYAATQARIDSERVNAARLEEARSMRASAPSAQVAERLRLVPPDSAYHAEAQSLIAELTQSVPVTATPTAATPVQEPRVVASPVRVAPESRGAPASTRVSPEPTPRVRPERREPAAVEPAAETGRTRAEHGDAMALYRAEKFSEAALALDRLSKRGGKAGADAAAKARLVRTFADEWSTAEKAVRARRAKEAVSALQKASGTDRKLGGVFRDRIDQQLAEQSYTVAIQAFNRQAYDEAIEANARTLQLMPGHPQAPRLQDKMRKGAGLILREGQRALADGDREAAQRLARALIKLLPRDDANQRPARDLLARAGG